MNLRLFSSTTRGTAPNLVEIQDPALFDILPTVLVAPLQVRVERTAVRPAVEWKDAKYLVLCDLIRPIRRTALREIGQLDASSSRRIIDAFLKLLPIRD